MSGGDGSGKTRRRLDLAAPIGGLFFLAVAGLYVAGAVRDRPVGDPMVVAGIVLVAWGVVGIVQLIVRANRH
ncbi:hypothetical protein [Actinomadura rupiterrae]|uniref:hypothetical protein n=1 Tax=Actinomadura rupiterrae TaxID=559627 RepID=UPI0020A55717|nr:hypothetical protein [Actinomadura rupiterrae]MCP2335530.1 hypothetical protein [Actinomadura rupiterrae]